MPLSPVSARRSRIGCLVAAAVLAGLAFGCCRCFFPDDEVAVSITDIPGDTDFLCVLADTPEGPKALRWSIYMVIPSSLHPDGCTVSRGPGERPFPSTYRA